MITDRIASRLRLFSPKAVSAPQILQDHLTEPARTVEMRQIPIEIFRGPKTPLRDSLYRSLQLPKISSGALIPLPDQDGRKIFLCDKNETGNSKFWLPPEKWEATLTEFGDFLLASKIMGIKMEVTNHLANENGGSEWILTRPVQTREDNWKVRENDYLYGITSDGKVSFGPKHGWYLDLGYLSPKRAVLLGLQANHDNSQYEADLAETLASLR